VEKKMRLAALRKILERASIGDQGTLAKRLSRAGIRISQASLSRDLRELGAQRLRRGDGTYAYVLPEDPPAATTASVFEKRFATSATGVRRAGFVVLVFTPPGEANLVGRLLDTAQLPGLLGNVAGDDTILCIAENERAAKRLEKKFKENLR
jgi:transcriptional regulator of arginine metabolism